jgi:tetratricopeptide (TPR) repeat protein
VRQAQDVAQRGQQAAILGDRVAARDQLRQAAALDPSNADLAYQLARAEESTGRDAEATTAYCRFIALAPDAPEAAEARARLAQLILGARQADSLRAAATFASAVTAYQNGQLDSANAAFTTALSLAPDWAAAYYDRGVVRRILGRRADAASDFQQYLRLEPGASNHEAVAARVAELQEQPLSPARALTLGLVIPGAGQFYAGRPVRGALTLIGTGVALACGLSQRESTEAVQQTALDPFGNPYTYTVNRRVTDRPCRTPGFTAAGVIALVSAVDAFRFARR